MTKSTSSKSGFFRRFLGLPFISMAGFPALIAAQELVPPDGPSVLSDLRVVLDTGVVLQDGNDDQVVDGLDLRLLLAPDPTETEVAAAANLAARFGFETSATDLGLAGMARAGEGHDRPVVLVGASAVDAVGLPDGAEEIRRGLAPGQGVLGRVARSGAFSRGGLSVTGYDATGLMAVAGYLSGRYPGVWEPDGVTWKEVGEKVEEFLEGRDLKWIGLSLDQIVVEKGLSGIPRARMVVFVHDGPDFEGAVAAFLGEDTVSAGHEDPGEKDPGVEGPVEGKPDTLAVPQETDSTAAREDQRLELSDLEFRGLHRLDVKIESQTATRTLTLRPREPWELRDPAAFRPGADVSFSLPGIYQVGGLFRDTNRDLVPDETAAFISLSGSGGASAVVDLASRIGLETAGARLPLVHMGAGENDPTTFGFPILVGTDHYQLRRLQEEGKLPETEVGPGEGFVQFVEN
ncbi:MAG: hypothetical protein PVJ76_13125, partial [Gemmatimonadota bacterium]